MLRLAVVDDDSATRQLLCSYLEQYRQECGEPIKVTEFTDGDELVEAYRSQFDLILLDVEMKFLDGMSTARAIRQMDAEVIIIFITNMAQYAIQGYEVDALDYVLKPVSYFALTQRINRAIQKMHRREKRYFTISVRGGTVKLETGDIYYVESFKHQLTYHTRSGDFVASGTIQQAEETLPSGGFFRSGKSYLVNLDHVDGVRGGFAVIHGDQLPISRAKKTAFLEALADHVSGVK